MKGIQFVYFAVIFFFTSCSTLSDKKEGKATKPFLGKWTHVETMYSIGGPAEWHPVEPAGKQIELKEDGAFLSSGSFLKDANH